nr:MAG TPA: hypothetical protein [Bacteriophage sp.]
MKKESLQIGVFLIVPPCEERKSHFLFCFLKGA